MTTPVWINFFRIENASIDHLFRSLDLLDTHWFKNNTIIRFAHMQIYAKNAVVDWCCHSVAQHEGVTQCAVYTGDSI